MSFYLIFNKWITVDFHCNVFYQTILFHIFKIVCIIVYFYNSLHYCFFENLAPHVPKVRIRPLVVDPLRTTIPLARDPSRVTIPSVEGKHPLDCSFKKHNTTTKLYG